MADELVFVPQVGFRWKRALGTKENVVVERDGVTFVGGIAPDRDGCRLTFSVSGISFDGELGPLWRSFEVPVHIHDDRGRDISKPRPRWSVGGSMRREADGTIVLHYGTVLEALAPDVRHAVVEFGGPAGEWRVELPVAPADLTGTIGRPVNASDTKQGITIAAGTVARSDDATIVELEAFYDPPELDDDPRRRRHVRGIGQSLHAGRLCGDPIVMRDDAGSVHFEKGHPCADHTGGKHREIVSFAALPAAVRSAVLEVEYVWVSEPGGEVLTLPLPGEADITAAGCEAHVVVTRLPGVYTEGSVRVECEPRDPDADRQLVFMEGVDAERGARLGMRISHAVGKRPVVEVPEPTGKTTTVTLQSPVIQLRSPWRLTIPLATR